MYGFWTREEIRIQQIIPRTSLREVSIVLILIFYPFIVINLSKIDGKFWEFTLQDLALKDIPDCIDFVQKITRKGECESSTTNFLIEILILFFSISQRSLASLVTVKELL